MTSSVGTWSTRPWVLPIVGAKAEDAAFSDGCIHTVVHTKHFLFNLGNMFEMKESGHTVIVSRG